MTDRDMEIAKEIYNTYWDHPEDHPLGIKPIREALRRVRNEVIESKEIKGMVNALKYILSLDYPDPKIREARTIFIIDEALCNFENMRRKVKE